MAGPQHAFAAERDCRRRPVLKSYASLVLQERVPKRPVESALLLCKTPRNQVWLSYY